MGCPGRWSCLGHSILAYQAWATGRATSVLYGCPMVIPHASMYSTVVMLKCSYVSSVCLLDVYSLLYIFCIAHVNDTKFVDY